MAKPLMLSVALPYLGCDLEIAPASPKRILRTLRTVE